MLTALFISIYWSQRRGLILETQRMCVEKSDVFSGSLFACDRAERVLSLRGYKNCWSSTVGPVATESQTLNSSLGALQLYSAEIETSQSSEDMPVHDHMLVQILH